VRAIKRGESVGIFPEGDGSWDGETMDFARKIVKLLKLCAVPVVTVRNSGGYLTRPKWAESARRGKIQLQFDVIDADELARLSEDKLYELIKERIYVNDVKSSLATNVKYKGKKLAAGIQYLLWKCPRCEAEGSIAGKGNQVRCAKCGAAWDLSANLRVTPLMKAEPGLASVIQDLKDWNDWQKAAISNKVNGEAMNGCLAMTEGVRMEVGRGSRKTPFRKKLLFSTVGTGRLRLTREALIMDYLNGAEERFDIGEVKYCVECLNKYVKFYYQGIPRRIFFNGQNSYRYIEIMRELREPPSESAM
jgi:1-acyl-sn-glycerol-3-phosphate acyltransferase